MDIETQEAEGMMWWRVQFHTDGSIKSISETEYVTTPHSIVSYVYVQANDKASACIAAKKWLERRKEICRRSSAKGRKTRIAEGLCVNSGCRNPAREGVTLCQDCQDKKTARTKNWHDSVRAGIDRRLSGKTPVQQLAERKADNAVRKVDTTWLSLLRRFDELGPEGFRAWLVSKIPAMRQSQDATQAAE
jgi:hypothetical protein